MDTQRHHRAQLNERVAPLHAQDKPPSLEQVFTYARDLYEEATSQCRDVGKLASLELELAVSSFHWWLWAVIIFCVCSVMACTFVMAATVLMFTDTGFSGATALLVMGGLNASAACLLFIWARSLSRKMTFRTLRKQLIKPVEDDHVKTSA